MAQSAFLIAETVKSVRHIEGIEVARMIAIATNQRETPRPSKYRRKSSMSSTCS